MSHARAVIEVLASSIGALRLACLGGADRIELCDNYAEGGTTASAATIELGASIAAGARIPVMAMIRPRGGGFVYDRDEADVMARDVQRALFYGATGVVLGALNRHGDVDVDLTSRLIDAAQGAPVTFHRAVDVARDPMAAALAAFDLGCDRVLTSGGAATAPDGANALRLLMDNKNPGAIVVAGGGINSANVAALVARSGVQEIHVSAKHFITSGTHLADSREPGLAGVDAGPGPAWPRGGWPAPDVEHLAAIRLAATGI